MFNEPFSLVSGCSRDWQIYHFLAFFPQSDHYLVGHVKVSILISTDTEKPQLSMKFPYKTCVSFSFLDIYCLEHIYYSAGSSNAKLAQEANQRGRQGLQNKEEKIENKIMTFPPGFQLLLFLLTTAGNRNSTFKQGVNIYSCFMSDLSYGKASACLLFCANSHRDNLILGNSGV